MTYFELDATEQYDFLEQVNNKLNKPLLVIEKDIWLTQVMSHLFSMPESDCMSFGGGTSLSKAFNLIDRFSEDIDIIYDVRILLPDDVAEHNLIPDNRSGADRRTKHVRHALNSKIDNDIVPFLAKNFVEHQGVSVISGRREGSDKQPKDVIIGYPSVVRDLQGAREYITSQIAIEFRGTSTGEPRNAVQIRCICDGLVEGISFPKTAVNAVDCKKTLLDKMMHIHAECLMENEPRMRTRDRYSRHWFDVSQMAGLTESPDFPTFVGNHLQNLLEYRYMFFPKFTVSAKDDFQRNSVRLVPSAGSTLFANLQADYQEMLDSGMIYGNTPPSFKDVLEKCHKVSEMYNALPWPP